MRQVYVKPSASTRGWYVYLAANKDDQIYVGISTDPIRRVHEHNYCKRGAKWARMGKPIVLLMMFPSWQRDGLTRSEALKHEATLKKASRARKIHYVKSLSTGGYYVHSLSRLTKILGGMPSCV